MKGKTGKIVRLSFSITLSVITAVLSALLLWQILSIYFNGREAGTYIFTRQKLLAAFKTVSPAFYIWVAGIICGCVLWQVFPEERKRTPYKDGVYLFNKLKKRIPSETEGEYKTSVALISKNERAVYLFKGACLLFVAAGIIYTIIYLALPKHFTTYMNADKEVLALAKNVLPFAVSAFMLLCGSRIYESVTAKTLTPEAKKVAAARLEQINFKQAKNPVNKAFLFIKVCVEKIKLGLNNKWTVLGVRIAVGCIGVAFIIAGICNGNMAKILVKATNICMECIGLG